MNNEITVDEFGNSQLMRLVMQDKDDETIACINNLDKKNPDAINHQNNLGWSALMFACKYDKIEVIKALIKNGANVNLLSKDKKVSALTIVEQKMPRNEDLFNMLLKAGAKRSKTKPKGSIYNGPLYR